MRTTTYSTGTEIKKIFRQLVLVCFCCGIMASCGGDTNGNEAVNDLAETESVTDTEQETDVRLETRTTEVLGSYLTDASGRSLYLFKADSKMNSTCYDACAEAWPPLMAHGTPAAGEGVDASKIGTIERRGGGMQVTYNGWPLYYYVKDQGAGQTKGQDIMDAGAEWYLVSPEGQEVHGEGH